MRAVRRRAEMAVAIAVCLSAFVTAAHAGPVTYVRQSRGVIAELSEVNPGTSPQVAARAEATAPDLGTFGQSVTAVIADPPAGQPFGSGQSTASQRSSLTPSGIDVAGSFRGGPATPNGIIGIISYVNPWFDLDQRMDYHLTYRMEQPDQPLGQEASFFVGFRGGRTVINELGQFGDDGSAASGEVSGTLAAGEYVLIFRFAANALAASDIDYSARLELTPAAAVIPLPPALWPGMAGIAACVAGLSLRRRRARR